MKQKQFVKRCLYIVLVTFLSLVIFQKGYASSGNIRTDEGTVFGGYTALFWKILKEIAVFIPAWFLSLLGLARSFLGDNWFPFAERISVRMTKAVLTVSGVLLAGVFAAEKIYGQYTVEPFRIQDTRINSFAGWQSVLLWILFYGMMLYIEQWSISRMDSKQGIRKKQLWVTVTLLMTQMVVFFLRCVDLWYIPLTHVDSPNTLEDYELWWFSLYMAAAFLPLWFFAVRKTIRLFMNNEEWLTISAIIPRKIIAMITVAVTGFVAWQIQECRYWRDWTVLADVPEFGEAASTGHLVQALMWGLVLFYTICLLVKQIQAERRSKCETKI